jgi:hypothetical protein
MFGFTFKANTTKSINNASTLSSALSKDIGMKLARCAIYFSNYHQQKLGVPCPKNDFGYYNASVAGQYPKKRTGFLQSSVAFAPDTIPELARASRVKIGYQKAAFYGPVLEIMMKRSGLVRSLTDITPILSKIAGAPMRVIK